MKWDVFISHSIHHYYYDYDAHTDSLQTHETCGIRLIFIRCYCCCYAAALIRIWAASCSLPFPSFPSEPWTIKFGLIFNPSAFCMLVVSFHFTFVHCLLIQNKIPTTRISPLCHSIHNSLQLTSFNSSPCLPLVICHRFFNLFEECERVSATLFVICWRIYFVKIISIARVRIFPFFLFIVADYVLCLVLPFSSHSLAQLIFRLFISCVFYYRLCYLKVCRSTMTTTMAYGKPGECERVKSKTYEKPNIKSMVGEESKEKK